MTTYRFPKDPAENVRWRLRCRDRAMEDRSFREAFYQACMEDPLFFFNAVLWVYEPRAKVKTKPFVTWPHQDPVILRMDETIDEATEHEYPISLTVPKSRAQGGTYLYLGVMLRRALKDNGFSGGLVTRNEELVDSRTDSSAVMYKLAWMADRLPAWFLPDGYQRNLTEHTIALPNGSLFSGYSATGDVARGGRTTMFAFDEPGSEEFVQGAKDYKVMSSVSHVSNCVAEGTLVVTERGVVPIEEVKIDDRVWDGNMWVSQDGCVYKGRKNTIRSYRVGLTPDHRVLTVKGWRHAIEGFDRAEIRLPDGYWKRTAANSSEKSGECVLAGEVRLRESRLCSGNFSDSWKSRSLHGVQEGCSLEGKDAAWNEPHFDTPALGEHDSALHEPEQCSVSTVRRTRDRSLRAVDDVRELLGRHGGTSKGSSAGTCRQQRELLPRELPLGDDQRTGEQPEVEAFGGDVSRTTDDSRDCGHSGRGVRCDNQPHQEGHSRGRTLGSIPVCDRLDAVYDLLNCGPRRAFTVIDDDGRPLLVHNCTFLVSTFGLDSGVFYESATDPDNDRVITLDWKDNPDHGKDAYVFKAGVAEAIRPEEADSVREYITTHQRELKSIERRGHKIDSKVRSPWYDAHCLLPGATPRFIARELDMDPRGAVGKLFDTELLDTVRHRDVRPPVWRGKPIFDSETLELKGLIKRDDGPLKLWFKPGLDDSPPLGPFSVGCDIAMGSDGEYSSNSCASIIDDRTGEQVGEYTMLGMQSMLFADNVIGLCLWLRRAKLGWEDSGISGPFGKQVMEVRCYGNVYFREVAEIGSRKKTRKAGWANRKDEDKAELFENMSLAMASGKYIARSEDLIRECGEYEWEKGKIIHRPTKNRDGNEKTHGDRCIGAGVAYLVHAEQQESKTVDSTEPNGETAEYGSFLWREQREKRKLEAGGPEFSIRDLLLRE